MPYALTFDDGPGPSMPALLDVLAAASVHATFFVMGRNIEEPTWSPSIDRAQSRAMVLRAIAEGHEIANHSYTHTKDYSPASADAFMREVPVVDALIRDLRREAGANPDTRILLRLPYGENPPDARADALRAIGRPPIHWTQLFEDWIPRDPDDLVREIIAHVAELDAAGKTANLTLHASAESAEIGYERPWTVAAVRMFLDEATRRNWKSVPCPA